MKRSAIPSTLTLAFLAAAVAVAEAPPAAADPLCYSVSTTGSLVGPRTVGPACEPYPFGVSCGYEGAGFSPYVGIVVRYCTP